MKPHDPAHRSDETSPDVPSLNVPSVDGEVVEWLEPLDPRFDTAGVANAEEYLADGDRALVNALPKLARYAVPSAVGEARQRGFLVAYATNGGNVTMAAQVCGLHRRTHYYWLDNDPVYAAAFADAHEAMVEYVEAEVHRRAVEGWIEPIFGKDGMIGVKRKFSDTLLAMRTRALAPERYGEKATTVAVTVDVRTQIEMRESARERVMSHARQMELAAEPIVVDAEIVDDDEAVEDDA